MIPESSKRIIVIWNAHADIGRIDEPFYIQAVLTADKNLPLHSRANPYRILNHIRRPNHLRKIRIDDSLRQTVNPFFHTYHLLSLSLLIILSYFVRNYTT